jgi:bifunctional non-homologous end joining protein LigD
MKHSARDASQEAKPSRATTPRVAISAGQMKELRSIRLTHPDRILYPDLGLTKRDLVQYYAAVSERMLPHVLNRPVSLVRCPDGQGGSSFYQKHAAAGTPSSLARVMIREKNKTEPYLAIQGLAGLLSVVQMGVLEIHPWGSTLEDLEKPDRLVFDLDPDPSVPWPQVIAAAKEVRQRLQDLGLESLPKLTGGKGIHLVVPVQRRHEWPEVKKFCRVVATQLAADAPSRYTANMSKSQRHGRIYIDYLRNERGATAIAPYSTRNRPGAPVAAPLTWKELSSITRPDQFNVENMPERVAGLRADAWTQIASIRQSLSAKVLHRLAKR